MGRSQRRRLPLVPAECEQSYHMFYVIMPSFEGLRPTNKIDPPAGKEAPSKRASHAMHRFILHAGAKQFDDKASLFTFKNDSCVWDAHWLRVDPCMDIPEKLRRELAIL